jgi:hypothetical protein
MGGFTAVKQVKMRTVLAAIAVVVASTMTYSMTYSGCTSGPGFATTYGSELCAGVVCPCNCCVDGSVHQSVRGAPARMVASEHQAARAERAG